MRGVRRSALVSFLCFLFLLPLLPMVAFAHFARAFRRETGARTSMFDLRVFCDGVHRMMNRLKCRFGEFNRNQLQTQSSASAFGHRARGNELAAIADGRRFF